MKTITGISTALVLFGLLCLSGIATAQEDNSGTILADDIQPYNGPIGADSPLYGLKLALEDMDESFTADDTERVDKQMNHAQLRLSEVRRSLDLNQSDSAEEALNNYWLKLNLTNSTITRWNSNASGLLHAQEQIARHQFVLENLLAGHPNNTGLQRAYNNSLRLEERFGEKTMMKFNRTVDKNNQTIMKAIRLGTKKMDHNGWPDTDATITATPDNRQKGPDKDKENGKGSGNGNAVTTVHTQAPSGTVTPQQVQQDQGSGQSHDQDNQPDNRQNGNSGGSSGDKGKGNSKNK